MREYFKSDKKKREEAKRRKKEEKLKKRLERNQNPAVPAAGTEQPLAPSPETTPGPAA